MDVAISEKMDKAMDATKNGVADGNIGVATKQNVDVVVSKKMDVTMGAVANDKIGVATEHTVDVIGEKMDVAMDVSMDAVANDSAGVATKQNVDVVISEKMAVPKDAAVSENRDVAVPNDKIS